MKKRILSLLLMLSVLLAPMLTGCTQEQMSITEAVSPGRSCPVIPTSICSSLSIIYQILGKGTYFIIEIIQFHDI